MFFFIKYVIQFTVQFIIEIYIFLFPIAYKSFIMYSRVTKIDSIHLTDERDLNSPYPPIQDK